MSWCGGWLAGGLLGLVGCGARVAELEALVAAQESRIVALEAQAEAGTALRADVDALLQWQQETDQSLTDCERVGPGTYAMTGPFDSTSFLSGVRILREGEDPWGRVSKGLHLYVVREGSLFWRCGFRQGDTILGVNGTPLPRVIDFAVVGAMMLKSGQIDFNVVRDGAPRVLTIRRDAPPIPN